jgi:subtilase family serine protease
VTHMQRRRIETAALAAVFIGCAQAQVSWLDQEAHRPYQRASVPDNQTPHGYTPQQMRHAYGVDQIANQGEGQIIGIVDGFDYPAVESDLAVFTSTFDLPPCTKANGCLTVIYASGTKPPANAGWTGETSLDVQWAHAIAPRAKIVLVEAADGKTQTLIEAVPVAVANGATVINMSWGTFLEQLGEQEMDAYFKNPAVTYFNASGDDGHNLFGYPGASTLVVGAGGTALDLDADGNILSEKAWSGSGGGASIYYAEPPFQIGFQSSGQRGVPDVAYNASAATGVPVYDSDDGDWAQVGGTSASSPQWCAITAIANSIRAGMGKGPIGANFLDAVYANPLAFHDITTGSNGKCGSMCDAGPGWDFVTGLGSPNAPLVVDALASAP